MHEDLKILCYGDVLEITLPINETTIERAIAIIKERGLTKLSIACDSPQAPTYSLKFLNDFTEATRITSLKLYRFYYDCACLYRFENLEELSCYINNDETLDLSRFQKLKTLTTSSLEQFINLNNSTIKELCVFGTLVNTSTNINLNPKKLSQLHRLKCLRLLHKVKDFSFEEVDGLDNLERVVVVQCNITGIHSFTNYTYNDDATCVDDGTEIAKCDNCDETDTRTKSGSATGNHTFTKYVYNDDATCVDDGTETAKCNKCDETDTRTKIGSATGIHSFTNYTYNDDATCGVDGTETAKCDNCDETDTRTKSGSATGEHRFNGYTCEICGNYSPDAPVTQGLAYREIKNNNDEVIAYSVKGIGEATATEILIPKTYSGKSVTNIEDFAFYNCSGLTGITIPNSVTSIGNSAFYGCTGLTNITIPNSVTSIDYQAFCGCSNLTSITMSNSVTSIGSYAFSSCSSLTSITIPNGVRWISEFSFSGCRSLTSITIPNSVTDIGKCAFHSCSKLTSITIPNSVISIGYHAFLGCSNLTSITIPNGVTSIGSEAFYGCSNLTSMMVESGNPMFHSEGNCIIKTSSKTLIIGCRGSSISCNGSVTSIERDAFSGCSSLTSITIPNCVTSIGKYAFSNCRSLTIYCEADSKPSGWNNSWNNTNCPVVWDCSNNDTDKGGYKYTIIDNVRYRLKNDVATVIEQPSNIHIANIPMKVPYKSDLYSVTSIGAEAFSDCSSLTSITLPTGVTSIGKRAFFCCSNLTSMERHSVAVIV